MTSPNERRIRAGCESTAPRTPEEFAARWKASSERQALMAELEAYEQAHPSKERFEDFAHSRKVERKPVQRLRSPYTIPYLDQIWLCVWRGWKRLLADPVFPIAQLVFQLIMALVLGSAFYDLPDDTSSFYHRGALIFFALLFNAFASELEVRCLFISLMQILRWD